jgi:hypothetical protein
MIFVLSRSNSGREWPYCTTGLTKFLDAFGRFKRFRLPSARCVRWPGPPCSLRSQPPPAGSSLNETAPWGVIGRGRGNIEKELEFSSDEYGEGLC